MWYLYQNTTSDWRGKEVILLFLGCRPLLILIGGDSDYALGAIPVNLTHWRRHGRWQREALHVPLGRRFGDGRTLFGSATVLGSCVGQNGGFKVACAGNIRAWRSEGALATEFCLEMAKHRLRARYASTARICDQELVKRSSEAPWHRRHPE